METNMRRGKKVIPDSNSSSAAGGQLSEGQEQKIADKRAQLAAFAPRERILAAALKLFVEQGYFNTNVPDLSRESQCSVGSIYHNFKSKEDVATALYAEGIRAFRQALLGALSNVTGTDSVVKVESVVKVTVCSFMEFSEVNHQLSRYIWLCRHNEFMTGIIKHPTVVGFDSLGRLLTCFLKEGIRAGQIRKLEAHIIWSVLFGMPLAYVRDWLDGYNVESPRAVAEQLAEACWRALATSPGVGAVCS